MDFDYDRWGNRRKRCGWGPAPTMNPTEGTNNRATARRTDSCVSTPNQPMGYDAAGNLTTEPGRTHQYDGEGRIKSVDSGATATYAYDGDGRRAKKVAGGQTRYFFHDPDGNAVFEHVPGVGWETFNLYINGRHAATHNTVNGLLFRHLDHLGSPQLLTTTSGGVFCYMLFHPFGEYALPCSPAADKRRFTGKERDAETGLDYFGARYYASALGRFTASDNPWNDTTVRDPQSWNLYAYVRNNPLRYIDPNGEMIFVGGLSPGDRDELLKRINWTYGCDGCVSVDSRGFLEVDTSELSEEILAATDYLTGAIQSTSFFANVEVSNNDPNLAFGEIRLRAGAVPWKGHRVNAHLIRLDFADDRWISGDSAAKETFANTVFAHEVAHVYPRFERDPRSPGITGPVVDRVNRITDALGQPRRTAYLSGPFGSHWARLTFSKPSVDSKGRTKEKQVRIQWLKRNVGGKGVN